MLDDCPSGAVSGAAGGSDASFFSDFSELGHGLHHVFFRARRRGRWYVLKALREDRRGDAFYEEWLAKEAAIGAQLDHVGVVRVEGEEVVEPLGHCIVMDWVDGTTLDRWLATRPAARERRRVLDELLDAVAHCHRRGVYHHDLKPSNILITSDEHHVRLIDFGLSDGPQYAAFKQSAGTEGYAAPEQREGRTADHRADLYALGRIVRLLFPYGRRRAVRRCLQDDPERRPQSVSEMRSLLRPRRWPWAAALAVGLLLAGAVGIAIRPTGRVYATQLASGQRVYYRVLEHWPEARVALVYPGSRDVPWPDSIAPLQGGLEVPPTLRHVGRDYRVAEVAPHAFRNQFFLTALHLPEGLEHIGQDAFTACSGLRDTLVLPRSLRSIENNAFSDCSGIAVVLWQADSCTFYSHGAPEPSVFFRCSGLRTAVVAEGVRVLPGCLFRRADSLRTALLPEGLTEVGTDCFAKCHALDSVRFPSTLRTIEHGAFYECGLRRALLPDSVLTVGNYAFAYNEHLRHVRLGRAVRYVGNYAFADCFGLRLLEVSGPEPPELKATAFSGMRPPVDVRLPEGYGRSAPWADLAAAARQKMLP